MRSTMRFLASSMLSVLAGTLFAAATLYQNTSNKQPKSTDTKNGVKFSVELNSDSFHRTDVMVLKLEFLNSGDSPIAFFKHFGFGPGGLTLEITNEKGEWIPTNMVRDGFPPVKDLYSDE